MEKKTFNRCDRIGQELQKKISIIIQYSLKDPRIKTIITVSEVKVSRDLSYAQVFVSFLKIIDQLNIKKILVVLNKSSSYIRKLLCNETRLRIIPNIFFYYDNSLLKGNHISMILNQVRKKNENTLFCE